MTSVVYPKKIVEQKNIKDSYRLFEKRDLTVGVVEGDYITVDKSGGFIVLDFGKVSFMDSSGVGLVMGRYRNVSAHGGRLEAVNLPPWCYKIMKMSGLEKIAKIHMTGGKR